MTRTPMRRYGLSVLFIAAAAHAEPPRVVFIDAGPESSGSAVSGDGLVVTGRTRAANGNLEPFRWTEAGGVGLLGHLSYGDVANTEPVGINKDGSVIVGGYNDPGLNEAFRWQLGQGMVGIGDVPGGAFDSLAYAVSDDGSIVAGLTHTAKGYQVFRWTARGAVGGEVFDSARTPFAKLYRHRPLPVGVECFWHPREPAGMMAWRPVSNSGREGVAAAHMDALAGLRSPHRVPLALRSAPPRPRAVPRVPLRPLGAGGGGEVPGVWG